jgi:outer membrane protein TolC
VIKKILIVLISTFPLTGGELTLRDAQSLLAKNNFDLQAGEAEIKKVTSEIAEAKSAFYPSLDASASFNYVTEKSKVKITTPPNPLTPAGATFISTSGQNDRTEFGLDMSYLFFSGKSRIYNLKNKETLKSAKEQNLQVLKNRYSYTLGLMYFRWNLSYKQLDVRRKSVEQMARYTEQMRMLHEGGVVVLSKVLEGQAKLKSAQLDYILTRDQLDSLKQELFGLIDINDSSYMPQSADFAIDTTPIPQQISLTRPEIAIYDKNVEQLNYTKKINQALRYPAISGNVGYRVGNPGLNNGLNTFMDYFQFGAQARWNILDGSKSKAQRAQIQQQIAITEIDKEKSLDYWNRSLNLWKQQVSSADEKIVVAQASLDAAQELMVSLENSLKAGVVTDVDYESAVTSYVQAGLQVEQAKFSRRTAILSALYASGKDILF